MTDNIFVILIIVIYMKEVCKNVFGNTTAYRNLFGSTHSARTHRIYVKFI